MTEGQVASVIQNGQCVVANWPLNGHWGTGVPCVANGTQGAQGPWLSVLSRSTGGTLSPSVLTEYWGTQGPPGPLSTRSTQGYPKGQLGLTPRGGSPKKQKRQKEKHFFSRKEHFFRDRGQKLRGTRKLTFQIGVTTQVHDEPRDPYD